MQELATAEQQTDTQAPSSSKHRRISKRIRNACDALVNGDARTVTAAAELANLSRSHLSRELSKPHIAQYLRNKAYRALAIGAGKAAATKLELLDSESDHVRDNVSTFLLALADIRPASSPSVSVNIELKAGYVIDLSEHNPRAAQIIEQNQIEAFPNVGKDDAT